MTDVFISYSRDDRAIARRFADAMGREGLEVWWDTALHPGEAFDEIIEQKIRQARSVVVLWSKNSVVSRWVRAEATMADRQKTLVPALIEACERPIMFELTHTADLCQWDGDVKDPSWRSFTQDIWRMVESRPAASRVPATPAPERPAPHGQTGPADRGLPVLGILPFVNRSAESGDEVFADGMVEDVGSALSISRGIKVIASSAMVRYRHGATDLAQVGRELGANYLLEGNIRRAGTNLRVTCQLVQPQDGEILWTQRFERPLSELAELQEELVTELAGHLGVQVQRLEMERALRKPGQLTAWEAVIRSTAAWRQIGLNAAARAVDEARTACALAPDFGLAQAALSHAIATLSLWRAGIAEMDEEAVRHADRALALDPHNPGVLWRAARGYWAAGFPSDGRRILEKAVRTYPNIADLHHSLGMVYVTLGMSEEALSEFAEGDALAPGAISEYLYWAHRAHAHVAADRVDAATEAIDRALELSPDYGGGVWLKAAICALAGRTDDSMRFARRHRRAAPNEDLETLARRVARVTTPAAIDRLLTAYRPIWAEAAPTEPVTSGART